MLLKIQSVSGRDVVHYDPGKWRFNSDCASFTNNTKATEDEVPVPTQVVITTADDLLPINSSKNYLMPYEKPRQNSGKGDVYASGGAFDDGPDDKDDFWKRPGGGLERTFYEWSLDKLSIFLILTGLQPNKEQERRPAIYLVVWHDGWRSTDIAIPVELWRVMVKRNHHQDPRVLRALSQNPVDPTAAYWQWLEQNPDLNKLYGTNPTLILDRLSLLALIPGKAPAPVRQPGGEQGKSSGQSGGTQNIHQQASHQPPETPDNNINKHHNSGEKGDGDGDHPGPSRNIKCAQCGVNPRVEPKLYCQDCLEQQEAAKSPVQEKDNTELNGALKEATIFGDLHAFSQAEKLIEQGATLELSFIMKKVSEFINPKPETSIWSTLISIFFHYEPVKERNSVRNIEPWVDLWIESHFIDIESEEWNKLILAELKAEYEILIENNTDTLPKIWLKWLSKKSSQLFFDGEFVKALKEKKYWYAMVLRGHGAKVNQEDIDAELEKAVADNDVERITNLHSLGDTEYGPAMTLLLKDLCSKDSPYSYSTVESYFSRGAVVTTKVMKFAISEFTHHRKILLEQLIKRAEPKVLVAGLNHAFSINKTEAIGALITLGRSTITSLITVELMQSNQYSYSYYAKILKNMKKVDAPLSRGIAEAGLQDAILNGNSDNAKFWISRGASADVDQLTKGLKAAAENGAFSFVKEWVRLGAKLSQEIIDKGIDASINQNNIEEYREWKELKTSPEQSQ
ncbi:hypothetical protein [Endozoicomonas euniceicola]|uniref:Uncharacterized protein n=1 Tax=Endozoicomonas euniceicola TaxID=1234143 RepID=A0ABY6GXT9_9GAMM|nr:hypothetical protein [Endozoicomonas euniceicola]UYM17609.1 hypothetical protein NX720_06805 [Endozoicomonas euniceicola]